MKQITLNFREVAVDGLPEKSMGVLVISRSDGGVLYDATEVGYSTKNEQFNSYDHLPRDESGCFDDVAYWVPMIELETQLSAGETP